MTAHALEDHAEPIGERRGAALLAPRSRDAVAACIAAARARGERLGVTGRGSQLDWCAPGDVHAWLLTPSLLAEGATGVIEYVAGDGTLTAEAGASLDVLREVVAEGGHRITPLLPAGATLGGALAAGRSGPDRTAFGPARHHVLGMTAVDGSGRIHRSGGRLVKNVTGFDLHRLHTGGRGRLGVVLEASLRLVPRPEAEVLLLGTPHPSAEDAVRAALAVRALPHLMLAGLLVEQRRVHVLLAGRERQVAADAARVRAELDVQDEIGQDKIGQDGAQQAFLAAWRGDLGLRVMTRPSRCVDAVRALAAAGVDERQLSVEPGAGIVVVPAQEVERCADDLAPCAEELRRGGASLDPRLPTAPAWAQQGPRGLERTWTDRLLAAFDPDAVFGPREDATR